VNNWQFLYEERAAIMEHDGGLSRAKAEREARDIIVQRIMAQEKCDRAFALALLHA